MVKSGAEWSPLEMLEGPRAQASAPFFSLSALLLGGLMVSKH